MDFHAPNFGDDGFDMNQFVAAGGQAAVSSSYFSPTTQTFVQSNPMYQQSVQPVMQFTPQQMWQAQPQYAQNITNLGPAMHHQMQERESSPMAGSPDSYGNSAGGGPIKKVKAAKKKKDPNEPKRPLSAYAMFFRDTQAAIKGQNHTAGFGEVSKIVASMWEGLDGDKKSQYKLKAEDEKKVYLKALTAYKAGLVATGGSQDNIVPSPPQMQHVSQPVMIEQHHPAQWAAQQMAQQPQQPVQIIYAPQHNMQIQPEYHQLTSAPPQAHMQNFNHQPLSVQVPMPTNHHIEPQQAHMQHQSPPQMAHSIQNLAQNLGMQQQSVIIHNNAEVHQHHEDQNSDQGQQRSPDTQQSSENQSSQQDDSQADLGSPQAIPSPKENGETHEETKNGVEPSQVNEPVAAHSPKQNGDSNSSPATGSKCIRVGCVNAAVDSPDWDKEYCSNECVVSHCREVFNTWVGQRQAGQPPVAPVVSQ